MKSFLPGLLRTKHAQTNRSEHNTNSCFPHSISLRRKPKSTEAHPGLKQRASHASDAYLAFTKSHAPGVFQRLRAKLKGNFGSEDSRSEMSSSAASNQSKEREIDDLSDLEIPEPPSPKPSIPGSSCPPRFKVTVSENSTTKLNSAKKNAPHKNDLESAESADRVEAYPMQAAVEGANKTGMPIAISALSSSALRRKDSLGSLATLATILEVETPQSTPTQSPRTSFEQRRLIAATVSNKWSEKIKTGGELFKTLSQLTASTDEVAKRFSWPEPIQFPDLHPHHSEWTSGIKNADQPGSPFTDSYKSNPPSPTTKGTNSTRSVDADSNTPIYQHGKHIFVRPDSPEGMKATSRRLQNSETIWELLNLIKN
jgi:hypothetical protein